MSMFDLAAEPRWKGQDDRVEVWYSTITDHETGTGLWVHYEVVAPVTDAPPYGHGWIAVFPPDAPPTCERFGRSLIAPAADEPWFAMPGGRIGPGSMVGRTETVAWALTWTDGARPLWTFPRIAWEREVLPGAQVLPVPSAAFRGTVTVDGRGLVLDSATGNVAHIYGHGNAKRWAWLHADLGDGDVLEIVTAVSRTPGLDRLPPTAFLRFRTAGDDWPRAGLPSARMRTDIALPRWTVSGRIGRRRVSVEVTVPEDRSVALRYEDPDGETATCTNSCVADARIVIERRSGGAWRTEREWDLRGTAHAEVGLRP